MTSTRPRVTRKAAQGSRLVYLKTLEIPIRYAARRYGETQISRFRHGVMLLRMVLFAYRRLKAFCAPAHSPPDWAWPCYATAD